jgi:hypothetical protein
MRVFIRSEHLGEDEPIVVGAYPDESPVKEDAHGDGVTVLTLPDGLVKSDVDKGGLLTLIKDWRARAGTLPVKTEAKRRIGEVLTISDQLNALAELVDLITKHGADVSSWPEDAKQHKAQFDERRNYVGEVLERARATPVMPRDPGSDKVWPRRLAKK